MSPGHQYANDQFLKLALSQSLIGKRCSSSCLPPEFVWRELPMRIFQTHTFLCILAIPLSLLVFPPVKTDKCFPHLEDTHVQIHHGLEASSDSSTWRQNCLCFLLWSRFSLSPLRLRSTGHSFPPTHVPGSFFSILDFSTLCKFK